MLFSWLVLLCILVRNENCESVEEKSYPIHDLLLRVNAGKGMNERRRIVSDAFSGSCVSITIEIRVDSNQML